MTITKRKKNSRQRGSKTHGWGAMKKHRGAGNRGGRGNAGSGKRGDANKPKFWKDKKFQGKFGFKKKNVKIDVKAINLSYFDDKLDKLLNKKVIIDNKGVYEVDLQKLGYNKLLSSGNVKNKYKITTLLASKKAIEKIESAGGEVVLPEVKAEKKVVEKKQE
jgi:large subunit ribosomal protein L15